MAGTYLTTLTSTSDADVYDFGSQSLGDAASDRVIVVASGARKSGGATTLSVSVGGVSATQRVDEGFGGNASQVGIDEAAVPTGTSGNVTLTYSATMVRCRVSLYRLVGNPSFHDSDFGTGTDPSGTIDIPAGGFACGVATVASNSTTIWGGLDTEDVDGDLGDTSSTSISTAHENFTGAETGYTITADMTGTTTPIMACASWGFSAGGTEHEITPSGGLTLGGASGITRDRTIAVSGGAQFGGEADYETHSAERVITPSGGVQFGGEAPIEFGEDNEHVITPEGGITLGGASPISRDRTIVVGGGVEFAGSAQYETHSAELVISPSGGVVLGGSAAITFESASAPTGRARMVSMGTRTMRSDYRIGMRRELAA